MPIATPQGPTDDSRRSPDGRLAALRVALALLSMVGAASTAAAEPYVYVLGKVPGSPWQQRLTVIDTATNTKGARINLGQSNGFLLADAMAIAPDGSRIFVINEFDATISVVSTDSFTVVDTWPTSLVGSAPRAVAVSPDSSRVYVSGNHQQFHVIDIASRTRVVTLTHNRGGSFGLAASPDGSRVYMMATGADEVVVFGTAPYAVLGRVPLDGFYLRSDALTLSADGRYLYVPRREDLGGQEIPTFPPGPPGVTVIDTSTNGIVTHIELPSSHSYDVATSPNGAVVYAPSYLAPGLTYRIDPATHAVLGTTPIDQAFTMAFLSDSGRAYVAANTNVRVVETVSHTVTTTIPFDITIDGRALAVVAAPPPPPQPPTNLHASAIGNRLSLTWDAPTPGDTVIGYVLEGGGVPGQTLASVRTGSTATSFSIDAPTGLWHVRLHAMSSTGRSSASNEVQVLVNVPHPPAAPEALLGLANGTQLHLSWTNPTAGGTPTSLLLDVSGDFAGTLPMPVGETFAFSGVPAGTYTLSVRAANSAGVSSASAPVTLTFPGTCPGPPQAPRNLAVVREGSRLTVTWDPPLAGPAVASYVLRVGGALTLTLPLSQRAISGIVPSGDYQLSVFATNACGAGVETPQETVIVP